MPRQGSIKSVFVEAIIFIGLLALIGHLSVNFWERFIIQSELTQMKTSLHTLKETLANIGTAYDNLHKELKGLVEITEKKHFPNRIHNIVPDHVCTAESIYKMDRRRRHDHQLKALISKSIDNTLTRVNKTTNNHVRMENKELETMKLLKAARNATTITRYPPKSTAAGQDSFTKAYRYERASCERHRCYRNNDFTHCQGTVGTCNNWRF